MICEAVFWLGVTLFLPCNSDELVKYYTELIESGKHRALQIELPTNALEYSPQSEEIFDCGSFHHVIIGAGSAGAVAANRLSENNESQILLLEAGGNGTDITDIPGIMPLLSRLEYNWNYDSVPQKNACLGMVGQRCKYHSGKGLGGSSLINGLIYSRGNKQDYDNWFAEGNTGWSYEDVLPYFKKSENFLSGNLKYHGIDGNLNVEVIEPQSPQAKAFYKANDEIGNKLIDYNGIQQVGYGKIYLNTLKGKRHSTASAFLRGIDDRTNLKVLTNAFVTKILIDHDKKAYGVQFNQNGRICQVQSKNDIVLSAGTISSPQILMLSGIGPKSHLEKLGIPVVQDLAVGRYLIDHPCLTDTQFTSNDTATEMNRDEILRQFTKGRGPLTNTFNAQGLGFFQTKIAKVPNYPDVEVILVPTTPYYESESNFFNTKKEPNNLTTENESALNNFYVNPVVLHPKSVGTLELTSKHWYDYPKVNPAFLTDEEGVDINTMYEGVQTVLQLINTTAFKEIDAKLSRMVIPACKQYEYLSRDYWYCRIRHLTTTGFHPVGTCKMGTDPKNGAVVDNQLRVHGISNLRVADASVIPLLISGHTNAPAIMIGERVADFIKNAQI